MKHLALEFFFIREKVANQEVPIQHIPSYDQLANLLTKPLSKDKFLQLMSKISVLHGSLILLGNVK